MKIRKLFADGFRGLRDQEYSLINPRTDTPFDLVLVTGPRASGKTSFLEAIIAGKEQVGPYGSPLPASAYLRRDARSAKVRIDWHLSEAERARYGVGARNLVGEAMFGPSIAPAPAPDATLAALLGQYTADPELGKVEYFHASRSLPVRAMIDLSRDAGTDLDRRTRLGRDDTKYSGLLRFLVEAGLGLDVDAAGKAKPQGRVTRAFTALCPTKRLAGLYRSDGQMLPAFADAQGQTYSLAQLADSELDALLFAATFVRAGVAGSVVLVDVPERHLGDLDTRAFVHALAALGADNQLIVATQSPSLLASVHADQVIRLG